jgi:hypothetical protein
MPTRRMDLAHSGLSRSRSLIVYVRGSLSILAPLTFRERLRILYNLPNFVTNRNMLSSDSGTAWTSAKWLYR